ncbi:MAG: chemotaxis protein, partial [Campylobacterales bacterium]
ELNAQAMAMVESVKGLAAIVGLTIDESALHQRAATKPKKEHLLASQPKRQSPTPKPRIAPKPQSKPQGEDIFPLDEGDLKEF